MLFDYCQIKQLLHGYLIYWFASSLCRHVAIMPEYCSFRNENMRSKAENVHSSTYCLLIILWLVKKNEQSEGM